MKKRHLHIITVLSALLLPGCLFADNLKVGDWFKYEDMNYQVTSTNPMEVSLGGEYVTGGRFKASFKTLEGAVNIPSSVIGTDGNTYSVTVISRSAFSFSQKMTAVSIPSSVRTIGEEAFGNCESLTSIDIPQGVDSIGRNCFYGCTNLVSATIPSGVTKMGVLVFSRLPNLTTVTCGSIGVTMFNKCSALTKVTLTDDVTSIGDWAFQDCTALTDINLPDGLKSIGSGVFLNCSSLQSIVIPSNVTEILSEAFHGCSSLSSITLPEGLTSIGYLAFGNCASLQSIVIPSTVTTVGYSVFEECNALTAVSVADMVSWLKIKDGGRGELSDSNYQRLYINGVKVSEITDLVIPEGTDIISKGKFSNWVNLKSVTLPTSLTSIESDGFKGCTSLEAVHIKDIAAWCKVDFTDNGTNNPLEYAKHLYFNGNEVTELVIPEGVTEISGYAFHNCEHITSVSFPSTLTMLHSNVFRGCTGLSAIHIKDVAVWCGMVFGDSGNDRSQNPLTQANHLYMNGQEVFDLVIPEGVKSISKYAFSGASYLKSLSIPSTMTTITQDAFFNCTGLIAVHIKDLAAWCKIEFGTNPLADAHHLFLNVEELTSLTIPDGVTTISAFAFINCKNVTTVTLGTGVKNIDYYAFGGCDALKEVTSLNEKPTAISNMAFKKHDSETNDYINPTATLYVPGGTKAKYEALEGWNTFPNIVEMMYIDPLEVDVNVNTDNLGGQDLSDNVIGNIYYNVGDNGYDASDGSIIISQATNMGSIANPVPGTQDVKNNFTGIILKVATGKGTITVNTKTSGNAQLVVQVGNGTPMIATRTEKGDVVVNYDVEEDTYVYIYAILGSSAARSNRTSTDGEVRIYGISVTPSATSINSIVKDVSDEAPVYNLSGQHLSAPRKGINIIGRKKVIVK